MKGTKSIPISEEMVKAAYVKVKSNRGVAGVDKRSIADFDMDRDNNLYMIWNRLSSGSYFPPAVMEVEIPKKGGKLRRLGIPTVSDRIAQMVIKNYLEPRLESDFHSSSFGYRPCKSAHQALEQARQNCWKYDWIIDLDIQNFFDEIDHELLRKALAKHVTEKWVLMYVDRWLTAPMEQKDGVLNERTSGTPQGGVISPLLANLMLHYSFDMWMARNFPQVPFERYADDMIVHCKTQQEAENMLNQITERFKQCKLRLHPEKTKIVYCKDSNRHKQDQENIQFDFLGYCFKPRESKNKYGKLFYNFSPAISNGSVKRINDNIKGLNLRSMLVATLEVIAARLNSKIRGWINYYGKYRKSSLNKIFQMLNRRLIKWVSSKYKRLRGSIYNAVDWLKRECVAKPKLFTHWAYGYKP
jgi:RNA-directed DNA polymerase